MSKKRKKKTSKAGFEILRIGPSSDDARSVRMCGLYIICELLTRPATRINPKFTKNKIEVINEYMNLAVKEFGYDSWNEFYESENMVDFNELGGQYGRSEIS